jgi:hypothetical protein
LGGTAVSAAASAVPFLIDWYDIKPVRVAFAAALPIYSEESDVSAWRDPEQML